MFLPTLTMLTPGRLVIEMPIAGWPSNRILYEVLWAILFVNIGWSIFNLAPVLPLDGGQVHARKLLHASLQLIGHTGTILRLHRADLQLHRCRN